MRSQFDKQLARLHRELIEMGALCEQAIALAAQALKEGDAALAGQVSGLERDIDRKERDIENLCLRLLLHQHIGDQADDIAELIPHLPAALPGGELLRAMARETISMVNDSVTAYVRQDVALAERVMAADDTVDDYFDRVKRSLISSVARGDSDGEGTLDILMVAKYFERIGDHATNIAEWVEFSVTGVHKEETT